MSDGDEEHYEHCNCPDCGTAEPEAEMSDCDEYIVGPDHWLSDAVMAATAAILRVYPESQLAYGALEGWGLACVFANPDGIKSIADNWLRLVRDGVRRLPQATRDGLTPAGHARLKQYFRYMLFLRAAWLELGRLHKFW